MELNPTFIGDAVSVSSDTTEDPVPRPYWATWLGASVSPMTWSSAPESKTKLKAMNSREAITWSSVPSCCRRFIHREHDAVSGVGKKLLHPSHRTHVPAPHLAKPGVRSVRLLFRRSLANRQSLGASPAASCINITAFLLTIIIAMMPLVPRSGCELMRYEM